ncbi:FAD-dependent monooxygenase [Rathayibacter sp. VKM Ac-2760]|uniref:FAD-dependent monooxygenase n=1 Tax=Rathayibacter sp. VKM Ac-2760 TaxID=2609253 RepID=UPI001317DEE5|nr:FAD-dependent monooxygenase [Rathayibacter sp. VKM Ac-2760]QHC58734.1 monooxygenase [Rathayibacter sp. VKM Ac-2760]
MNSHSRPTTQPDVLIVGGSLAGLLTAHTLAEVGLASTVLERAAEHRPSGAALAVDERQLLDTLGPERASAALGRPPLRRGAPLAQAWSQLYRGLRDAAAEDPLITLHHQSPVTRVEQDTVGARLVVGDSETLTADAVIGADGYRSIVRRTVAPEHADATFAGYVLWLGTAEEADLSPQHPWPRSLDFQSASGAHLLGYPLPGDDDTGLGRRRLGWAWYDSTRNDLLRASGSVRGSTVRRSLHPGSIPAAVYDELAREARRKWSNPWRDAILDSIARRAVIGTPVSEYIPERLARNRLALVGDAAHGATPMTGRGFATAVDDAHTLAATLTSSTPESAPVALDAYASARLAPARDLVRTGQRFSNGFGR